MSYIERVALVTGAARGLGAAIAQELAGNGYQVVINYKQSYQKALDLAQIISRETGMKALPIQADVASYQEVEKMVGNIMEKFGRIDVLVNNAGIARDSLLINMTEEDWDTVINTNLKSVYNCSKVIIPIMQQHIWGRIINIASIVGLQGRRGQTNYAASKAGMIAFTKSLSYELARWKITVNAVIPGFTETDMSKDASPKAKEKIYERIPLGHPAEPVDLANLVAFLASDKANYFSGQVFHADCRVV